VFLALLINLNLLLCPVPTLKELRVLNYCLWKINLKLICKFQILHEVHYWLKSLRLSFLFKLLSLGAICRQLLAIHLDLFFYIFLALISLVISCSHFDWIFHFDFSLTIGFKNRWKEIIQIQKVLIATSSCTKFLHHV